MSKTLLRRLIRFLGILLIFVSAYERAETQDLLPGDEDILIHDWNFDKGETSGWVAMHNLAPLECAAGVLKTGATGDDAYMGVSGLDMDTTAITHAIIRMRSNQPGVCQIYFSTTASPDPARNGTPVFHCPGDDAFHDFEVEMSGQGGWSGRLSMFRLDPVNASGSTASIEIDYIRLVRKAPGLSLKNFGPDRAWVRPGERVTFRLRLAKSHWGSLPGVNASLDTPDGAKTPAGGAASPIKFDEADDTAAVSWTVSAAEEPVQTYRVRVMFRDRLLASAEAHLIVIGPDELSPPSGGMRVAQTPYGAVVENDRVSLALYRGAGGIACGVFRARAPGAEQWQIAGVCLPLAAIAIQADRQFRWDVPQFEEAAVQDDTLTLRHRLPDNLGCMTLSFQIQPEGNVIESVIRLAPERNAALLRMGAPSILAGEGSYGAEKDSSLFPGIEFLEGAQRSSDMEIVGERAGYRPVPPPYQITVPMMAVCHEGVMCGLMWDALQKWDGEHAMPMAEFASPNFLDEQSNHLMAVFAPNWPDWTPANQRLANRPYELQPGTELVLKTCLFARGGADISQAVPLWYRQYGIPAPPRLAKPLEATSEDLIQGWAQTCYDPTSNGFVSHWRRGEKPGPRPDVRARILSHYLQTGDDRWIRHCRIAPDAKMLDILGSIFPNFGKGSPQQLLASQREDGTWGYECTPHVREECEKFSRGKHSSLGEPGTTNVGICASSAVRLLRHALATGSRESEEAGLRALKAMEGFKVPAGAQTWEVHKDIPDIYAAALAVDCYRMGYELTGERRYLDQARYWAYTGLPFLYAYQVPNTGPNAICHVPGDPATEGNDPFEGAHPAADVFQDPNRQVTPYGSIPVFGTSFYVVSWFGNLVQWCGLVWADSVYALLEHVDDPILQAAADGVLYSGCQQTFDKEPVVGLLPDTWHLGSNHIHPAFIAPLRVEAPLRRKLDRPSCVGVETKILRAEGRRFHINSRGTIHSPALHANCVTWTQRYLPGQTCETIVIGLGEPKSVRVDNKELSCVPDITQCAEGWQYAPDRGCLFLRISHREERAEVAVHEQGAGE